MSLRGLLGCLLCGVLLAQGPPTAGPAAGAPHIILMVVDDLAHDMLGFAAHPYIETPNLDRLAREGMVFTRAYCASPVCGPARGSLLSGLHASRHGNVTNLRTSIPNELAQARMPDTFQELGYTTGFFGKHHVQPVIPGRGSWSRYVLWNGIITSDIPGWAQLPQWVRIQWWERRAYTHNIYYIDGTFRPVRRYQTDYLFWQLRRFIQGMGAGERAFAYFSPFAPHYPFDPHPRHRGRYLGRGLPARPNRNLPSAISQLGPSGELLAVTMRNYEKQAETLLAVDDGVGRIIRTVEQSGLLGNAVIVFTSDNGFQWGEHGAVWKGHPWEESIRVPLVVWGPGIVAGGRQSDAVISHVDLLPTLAELGGHRGALPVDGRSRAAVLRSGQPDQDAPCFVEYYKDTPTGVSLDWEALIAGDYKVVRRLHPTSTSLFDLRADPFELTRIGSQRPGLRDSLLAVMASLRNELGVVR